MDESNKAPTPRALSASPKGSRTVAHDGPSPKAAAEVLVSSEALSPDAPVPAPAPAAAPAPSQVVRKPRTSTTPVGPSHVVGPPPSVPKASEGSLELPMELVARIRDVVAERCRVEGLIEATEEGRSEVKEEIYQKVRADYDSQLEAVRHAYEPLRLETVGELTVLRKEHAELRASLEHVEDELSELRFRFRVGEFGEDELARAEKSRLADVAKCETRLERLRATFALAESLLGEDANELASPPAPQQTHAAAAAEDSAAPPTPPTPPTPTTPSTPSTPTTTIVPDVEPPLNGRPEGPEAPLHEAPTAVLPSRATWSGQEMDDTAGNEPQQAVRVAPPEAAKGSGIEGISAPPSFHGAANGTPCLVMMTQAGEEIYPITPAGLSIGRSKTNHIVLAEPGVSRKHAVIRWVDGVPVVEDRSSGGGIVLNGQFVERALLKPGDLIQIVSFALRVRG